MTRRVAAAIILLLAALPTTRAFAASDPLFGHQWALEKIRGEQAWSASRGDSSVVAVVDTGVDFGHPDLAGKQAASFDCFQKNPCIAASGDANGHGTAVAGIIGAANNTEGIAPVAPGARIMSVKVLNENGAGSIDDVARGIETAADNGAGVINLSLAGSPGEPIVLLDLLQLCLGPCTPTAEKQRFQAAVNYAAARGSLIVAAAGNDNGLDSFYSEIENVLVVGATTREDAVAPYSSSGAEIFAPGGAFGGPCGDHVEACVLTTVPGGYAAFQGTSFAAPHVSGIAALLRGSLSPGQIVARILETADPIAAGKRANAMAAVGGSPGFVQEEAPDLVPERLGASSAAARKPDRSRQGQPAMAAIPPPPVPVIELPATPGDRGLIRPAGRRVARGLDLDAPASSGADAPATIAVAAVMLLALSAGGNGAYFWLRKKF
ncbi:MAG: S8 family serine peptidase [Actinomycetota bacterium]